MSCDLKAAKKALRKDIAGRTEELTPEYIKESNEGILRNILAMPEYKKAKVIFAYYSVGAEADVLELSRQALNAGKIIAMPCIYGKLMRFRAVGSAEELNSLEPGVFDIPCPQESAEELTPDKADMMLVPAAAFGKDGSRLGRGGGFYDRYLADFNALTVGVCREEFLFDSVPCEAHDRKVDAVVTEKGIARPRKRSRDA